MTWTRLYMWEMFMKYWKLNNNKTTMINIREDQRDQLLDLCETSKSVSRDYDKVNEIDESMQSLPDYLKEQYGTVNMREMNDNVQEKLNYINEYINTELIEDRPIWYQDILQEIEELYQMVGDTYSNDRRIHDAIIKIKADYWKDFSNK